MKLDQATHLKRLELRNACYSLIEKIRGDVEKEIFYEALFISLGRAVRAKYGNKKLNDLIHRMTSTKDGQTKIVFNYYNNEL